MGNILSPRKQKVFSGSLRNEWHEGYEARSIGILVIWKVTIWPVEGIGEGDGGILFLVCHILRTHFPIARKKKMSAVYSSSKAFTPPKEPKLRASSVCSDADSASGLKRGGTVSNTNAYALCVLSVFENGMQQLTYLPAVALSLRLPN